MLARSDKLKFDKSDWQLESHDPGSTERQHTSAINEWRRFTRDLLYIFMRRCVGVK